MVDEELNLRLKWLIVALALAGVLYILGPVLTPFTIAALFAYLWDPVVDCLERWRMSRTLAVCLVFAVMFILFVLMLIGLVPFTERQIGHFLAQLPEWINWFQIQASPWLQEHFGVSADVLDSQQVIGVLQEHWKEAGGTVAGVLASVSKSGLALVSWTIHFVVVPVATFYLLRDWDILVGRVHELIPRTIEPTVTRLARESDEVLGAFVRGQLSVMIALGVLYAIALRLVGIDIGPLIGMIAGIISFVPYLGAIIGVGMGVIAALVQYQDWFHVILVMGVFVVGHLIESYVLVPRLVGSKIGLHPVAVIFAVLAGGEIFGFLGVLLALPIASVIMVLLRYAHERYTESNLYRPDVIAERTVIIVEQTEIVSPPINPAHTTTDQ